LRISFSRHFCRYKYSDKIQTK